jgi:two-component system phosphate regulon response regulator PhoB
MRRTGNAADSHDVNAAFALNATEELPTGIPVILVADDDPDILTMVQLRLERCGYTVLTARNGREAVELTAAHLPNLIVLDIAMPELSGLDALAELKAAPLTSSIPVILLTARATSGDVQAGLAAGASEYLTKPFSPQELAARVAAFVERG